MYILTLCALSINLCPIGMALLCLGLFRDRVTTLLKENFDCARGKQQLGLLQYKIQCVLLYPSYKLQKLNMLASLYVYSLMVQSAPVEKIQGCMGCQLTSRTPNSSRFSCVCSFLSGTIKGFCSKSLKKQKVE